jgi:hypothetical protein
MAHRPLPAFRFPSGPFSFRLSFRKSLNAIPDPALNLPPQAIPDACIFPEPNPLRRYSSLRSTAVTRYLNISGIQASNGTVNRMHTPPMNRVCAEANVQN